MSIFEYDKEKEEKKLRKAEYEYGREQGREEGRIEGKKEGKEEGRKEFALKLLAHNFPLDEIANLTDLSIEEIKKLEQ